MTSRPSTAAPILAILAIVLVTLGIVLYPVGYFMRSQISWLVPRAPNKPGVLVADPPATGAAHMFRVYPSDWEAILFLPGAYLETRLTGKGVSTASPQRLF